MTSYRTNNDADTQQQWYGYNQQNWGQFNYNQPLQTDSASYYNNPYGQSANNNYAGNMFIPSDAVQEDFTDELPLLEELGINFAHIKEKTLAVLNPVGSIAPDVITDQDLAGPLVFCLLFGSALLLHGKLHFGYIYGIGVMGCLSMYALLNLMSSDKSISFTCTASVLGYCLLPMALISLLAVVLNFQATIGYVVSAAAVLWCSISSSKLFVVALSMDGQRLLVAYPCALLYCVFALLAIF